MHFHGFEQRVGCFVQGSRNGMGCFVRGGKTGMGCFVRGEKNCVGCFVQGGISMRDVLSGVSKNGMGCFVPGYIVLHSKRGHLISPMKRSYIFTCEIQLFIFSHVKYNFFKYT